MNAELIAKAKAAKNPEELLALARENGMEMTEEEAAACFEKLNPPVGELSDEELDNVAGGGCKDPSASDVCPKCGGKMYPAMEGGGGSIIRYYKTCITCGFKGQSIVRGDKS